MCMFIIHTNNNTYTNALRLLVWSVRGWLSVYVRVCVCLCVCLCICVCVIMYMLFVCVHYTVIQNIVDRVIRVEIKLPKLKEKEPK